MRSVNAFERCYGKVIYSRVSQRRVLRGESHQGSLGESLRKRKERERKDSKSSLLREGEKCEACGEGDGEGRTSGARSNDGDAWHTNRTAPTTVHSHTRRGYLTTRLPTKRQFSQRHPTTPSGTRGEQAVLHTPFGGTSAFGEGCGRRDDVSSPHSLPTSRDILSKNIPAIRTRHFIPASTTMRHDTPVSSPVRPSERIDPSHDA